MRVNKKLHCELESLSQAGLVLTIAGANATDGAQVILANRIGNATHQMWASVLYS